MKGRTDDADSIRNQPLAYMITFHTYGTWLHGTHRGSIVRARNVPGTPILDGDSDWERERFKSQRCVAFVLGTGQRSVVDRTIREVCAHRNWELFELNVRTNHVHVVVNASKSPERVMNDFKAYATRRMRETGLLALEQVVWARHGSTRYLWNDRSVALACEYVREGQGINLT